MLVKWKFMLVIVKMLIGMLVDYWMLLRKWVKWTIHLFSIFGGIMVLVWKEQLLVLLMK